MIERTFQLISSIGPAREKDLWRRQIFTWDDLPDSIALSQKIDPPLREAIDRARAALHARDLSTLALMLPQRERWRLFAHFADDAAYLDIETDGTGSTAELTAVGVLFRGEVRSFISGFNLDDFPAYAERFPLLVTFNGQCFDVPVLERWFRHFKLPRAHIDARRLAQHAGVDGGLKSIEKQLGLERPLHLQGLNGLEAVRLWRAWRDTGDRAALKLLVEYNLYDAVQLKPVVERLYNRTRERALSNAPELAQTERGDVLYDVTKMALAFAA